MMIKLFCMLIFVGFYFRGTKLQYCPDSEKRFEKILGLRPFSIGTEKLLFEGIPPQPITSHCLTICSSNRECAGFILYYNTSTCFWYKQTAPVDESKSAVDPTVAWFVKQCFYVKNCSKSWVFETVPGATFIGNDVKTLQHPVTRFDCEQCCLNETQFQCRSAKFKLVTAKTGICTLSDSDRHLLPNSYRVSNFKDEYLENQCENSNIELKNEFCDYEEYDNTTLAHSDELYRRKTKDECQKLCEADTIFNCRGYNLIPVQKGNQIFDCYLTTEDSKVYGPQLLLPKEFGRYYEKARCLNVSVECSETYLTVKYTPEVNFKGRIYMQGYSDRADCYAKGQGLAILELKVLIAGDQCGLSQAKSTFYNRTLLANTLVIQYNNLIQTQSDRLIRVGCIFGNDTKVLLGTGVNITSRPFKGGSLVNSTSNAPYVKLRILDLVTQKEAVDTQIGQELEMVIEIKPANSPYDIWAGHLIAMTENGEESIFLLDDRGCPTNLNIFPPMTKIITNTTNALVAVFQAFKFSSSPVVRFSVIVQFCPKICPPVDCGNNTLSFTRNIREAQDIHDGTTITNTNDDQKATVAKLPLEFVMVVRDPKINPDKLVLGDTKVLIAGYDLVTNEVCIDFSLLIGTIIVWSIVQIIFLVCCVLLVRRYKRYYEHESFKQSLEHLHRNFGLGFSNLDNRRVHWADNVDLT